MEILYAFAFAKGFIFETKNTTLPNTAPKSDKFCWKLVFNDVVEILRFSSMTETTREFENNINLNLSELTLSLNNEHYILTNIKQDPEILNKLCKYF